ncbi:MAG: LysR family transcriptional regulator [Alphaproteobacteria bacterium]|jgi:DNA-binding transcriptional LysR family regulator|nr:LysR family transcriptional regulator [Alphaproteobacteria bacterium]
MLPLETSPYFRDLDWEKLKAFYYVAKMGNISHAAPLMNLTQSAFSRHITGLEKHLGFPLFARKKGGVILTRRGEDLFGIAESVFIDMKEFTSRNYEPVKQGIKRNIRIATSQNLAAYLINDLILEYNKDHPNFVFEIIGVDQAMDVILYDVDLAIQPHDPKTDEVKWQVIQEPFFTLEKKLYASTRYLEKYGEPQTIDDLKDHHFIVPSISEVDSFEGAKRVLELSTESGDRRNHVFLSNSLECLIEAAQQGKGIISAYEKTRIVQNSSLKNILPHVILNVRQEYYVYPVYLKEDKDIMDLKEYLKGRIGYWGEITARSCAS